MANKKLQGITIEIGGNTKKLNEALESVNKTIYKTNGELKSLNNALKLDPKNTKLLADKQELLKNNINASKEKLKELTAAQKEMGKYKNLTDSQKESYRELTIEIVKSKNSVKNLEDELKEMKNIDLSKVGDAISKVGSIAESVISKVTKVTAMVGTAVAGVVGAGVKSYANQEQLVGGVETLFKLSDKEIKEYAKEYGMSVEEVKANAELMNNSIDTVIGNASVAYKTAGMSSNEYLETVTSFSASLLQSVGNDSFEAMEISDMAITDMADNANKMGTSIDNIKNAYQGFAKQNYTMLDNLKLGYGGTKSEMERLLSDAQKISGVKYDISNLSDVYNAIHVIQNEIGITGTTAKEAETTIQGSAASMQAAFDNFLNGSGSPEQLSEAIVVLVNNVVNAIQKIAPNIINGLITLLNSLLPNVIELITQMLPQLVEAAQQLMASILETISQNIEPISTTVVSVLMSFVNFLLENLPMIIGVGLQIIIALTQGISENLDIIIPAVVDCVLEIVDVLINNIDLLIDAAIQLFLGIITGLMYATPQILIKMPELISKLASALKSSLGKIVEVGKYLIQGLWEGIKNSYQWIKDKISGFGENVTGWFQNVFKIHSPSVLMKDKIGKNLGLGVAEGIDATVNDVEMAMHNLSSKVEASVNPTINPTANSNPLILQIDKFINNDDVDVQRLAEKLEFYRKNSALARGGV